MQIQKPVFLGSHHFMRTIYFQLQYGHIFCGDTAVVPYDTANAINAHELSVKIGIAIIIPMPVIPITTPIIDSIKPQKNAPQPYDCDAGLSKSWPQLGQW